MTQRLEDKVAVISGGARGQGESHAEVLAAAGARVIIGDVREREGEAVAARLSANGLEVRYLNLDVTSDQDWANAVEVALSAYGKLDVLVNNAGIAPYAGIAECTNSEWRETIAVNQEGTFYGMRSAIPHMRATGGGSIVNISSVSGFNGAEGTGAYQASKAAVIGMTRSAALTYGRDGIRVNAICPGVIDTPMLANDLREWGPEPIDALVSMQAIPRMGRSLDVSHAVLYLASDESAFVTGITLIVDGGMSAR